ncbi:hypothetical protein V5735_21990 (plasmid) [Haladaptatus sp. SPP-AMP-3]|uniref:hypothetical protein n=1 Tax=Haladaptatus sp. SPP-AMP-3 TaxID=3121295 RepID=UPI003C2F8B40
MSIVIDNPVAAQLNKDVYDSEFEMDALVPEYEDEEDLGPAKLCLLTCTVSCAVTVSI